MKEVKLHLPKEAKLYSDKIAFTSRRQDIKEEFRGVLLDEDLQTDFRKARTIGSPRLLQHWT